MSSTPTVQLFVLGIAVIVWAYAAYSALRAWKYRRPGTFLLLAENLTDRGQRCLRQVQRAGAAFVAVVVVLVILKEYQGK